MGSTVLRLAHPPLVLTRAEWESVRVAIETGQDHPLDFLLDVCHVVVVCVKEVS